MPLELLAVASQARDADRGAEHLLDIERKNPRRWFGFGGEVKALNAKAALLLGRALRRAGHRQIGDDG